ncbi:MAG: TCR/Tet family MFS transporter [Rhodobacterales bacterium]
MPKKLPILFLLITVVLDAMGIGLIMPVTPDLIRELLGADLSRAASWGGVLSALFAVMQFLFGASLGNLSDRYGRRPVLLVSLAVVTVDYAVMGLTGSIWILLLGRLVGGIASATQSTAAAYMADISDEKQKSANFGLLGAAFGIGFILGPIMGGVLGEYGSRAPFFAAATLAFANFIFGVFVLPETVTDKIRRTLEWRRMNPFRALRNVGHLPGVAPLLVMFFFHQVAFFVYPSVWAYYTREKFGWTAWDVGLSLSLFGLGMAVVQGGLIRLFVPRLGEVRTIFVGLSVAVLGFVGMAMAWSGWMAYALIPLTSLALLATPALQAIMSKSAPDDAQGELQGVLTGVGAIASIISPLMMTGAFSYFTRAGGAFYAPGAPFYLAAVLELIALAVFIRSARRARA